MMTPETWRDLQGKLIRDRDHHDWAIGYPGPDDSGAERHIGRVAAYDALVTDMDLIALTRPPGDCWAELRDILAVNRAQVGHYPNDGEMIGRAEAYDEVLAYMAEGSA
jgi:hypothetical protein